MKITVDIPDWAKERRIYLFLGRECWMIWERGTIYKKTMRCDQCGRCCMNLDESWDLGTKVEKGIRMCKFLEYQRDGTWICRNKLVPFNCIKAESLPGREFTVDCIMKMEEVGKY